MNSRISLLTSFIPEDADAALIVSAQNTRYFTDFPCSDGYLLITREQAYFLVDSRYAEAAEKEAHSCQVVAYRKLSDELKNIILKNDVRTILLEGSAFTLNRAETIEEMVRPFGARCIKDASLDRIISRLRIVKTADEVGKIRKAQRITEESLSETLKLIKEGVSERDLALELEYKMRKKGADGISFDLIALTGKKTSMPHGVPGYETVKNGDFILFDIGATYEGYHSDMTRTYVFGKADEQQKRVYNTVLQAQLNGIRAVADGVCCGDVDKAARDHIDQAGYEGLFGHSTGHGVGLEIHEAPSVSPHSDFMLRSGMVITVEPGIYIPDTYGVRIEDMVVVTNDGCINLATLPKELTEL